MVKPGLVVKIGVVNVGLGPVPCSIVNPVEVVVEVVVLVGKPKHKCFKSRYLMALNENRAFGAKRKPMV